MNAAWHPIKFMNFDIIDDGYVTLTASMTGKAWYWQVTNLGGVEKRGTAQNRDDAVVAAEAYCLERNLTRRAS